MNYPAFKDRFHRYQIFSVNDIRKSFTDFDSRRLVEWQEKGYIRKIINRWYIFADVEVEENMQRWMANRIYQPSYVSLESALAYYNLIPEVVYTTTSLTSNKTISFNTSEGSYSYRHIKPALFFGYHVKEWKGFPIKMASIEKAILDYLYLNAHIKTTSDLDGLRLNTEKLKKQLDVGRFQAYLVLFDSKALTKRANLLLTHVEQCLV